MKKSLKRRAYISWLKLQPSAEGDYVAGWLAGYRACLRDIRKKGIVDEHRKLLRKRR